MNTAASPHPLADRICPYCPLHCDDLEVSAGPDNVILSGGCSLAHQGAASHPALVPTIGQKEVSLEEAIAHAAGILNTSRMPMISGLACDVDGLRAAMTIADKVSAVFDHGASDGFFNNLHVLQRRGVMYTTPAEVRNRADVVVVLGTGIWNRLPRFFERYIPAGPRLFDPAPPNRKVYILGGPQQPGPIPGADVTVIEARLENTAELALTLAALVAGRMPQAPAAAGVPMAQLTEIAQALASAKYAVLAWEPPNLGAQGDLAVESLYDLILTLNKTGRAAGLPLPAGGHLTAAYQVSLWQAGTTLRTSFASGKPHYDPKLYSFARQTRDQRYDALLWVTSLPGPKLASNPDVPLVMVSSQAVPEGIAPEVFIPVAMPSRDHGAVFFRGEGVVSIHGSAWNCSSTHASAAAALTMLAQLLTEREVPQC
jgi:formylmethanofuran dehydrogenase subunit B